MNNKRLLYFYCRDNGKSPIRDYFLGLDSKVQNKIIAYVLLLAERNWRLGMPYTKHIAGKVWELRVDFNVNFHRLFYFVCDGDKAIFLHGFNKKTNQTPLREIEQALKNYNDFSEKLKYQIYEN